MPTGVVQWLDTNTGEGRVMVGGRRYAVRAEAMASHARYPGARVHFDIDHDAEGDVATNVELAEGTRVSIRQRRFGDLVGARARETKIERTGPDVGAVRGAVAHPMRVVEAWADHLSAGRLDDAVHLYAPIASYHAGGEVAVGPDRIRTKLADHEMFGRDVSPETIAGEGEAFRVTWSPQGPDVDVIETHLVVQHGEIVEQWAGETRSIAEAGTDVGPLELSVEGPVSADDRARAVDELRRLAAARNEPVHHLSVRLEWLADPAQTPRARARATLDVDGDAVRATVRGKTMGEAIDMLRDRLAEQLRRRADHRRALRRRGPSSGPGEWRHGDVPAPVRISRPDRSERSVVRRSTWSAEPCTFDEAVFDLEVLDLEFLLFTDLGSGQDGVVYRRPGGAYAVRLAEGLLGGQRIASLAAVELDPMSTPHISLDAARDHLDQAGERWLFFVDRSTGRGNVVYRRDDGHDGLITPRAEMDVPVAP